MVVCLLLSPDALSLDFLHIERPANCLGSVRQAINGAAKSNNNAVAPNADPIAANRIVQAGDYAQKSAPLQAADASGSVRNTFVSSQLNARGNAAVRAPTM